jgi:hypothetical protein
MKKILISSIVLAAILSTANASEFKREFFIMGGQNNVSDAFVEDKTYTDGGIGYGYTKYWDNGILAGGSLYIDGSGSDEFSYGVDCRLGYSYANVGVYGIVSGTGQTLGGSGVNSTGGITSYGIGGGGGVEYKFENWAIAGEYKTYSMATGSIALPDYTLTTEKLLIKYRF